MVLVIQKGNIRFEKASAENPNEPWEEEINEIAKLSLNSVGLSTLKTMNVRKN